MIMDVGLPDIDGREAVRILRRNGFQGAHHASTGDADILTPSSALNRAPTASRSPSALPCCLGAYPHPASPAEASEDAIFAIGPSPLARVEAAA